MQRQLTTNEIGRLVGVSERTVANWIDRGYLNAFRTPGGHRRVDPRHLAEFLGKRGMPVPDALIDKVSILIVEDDVQVADTLRNWLSEPEDRYDLKVVHSGVEALLHIGGKKPRLVLLDVLMPGMDGIEVCRKIKADANLADVEVLFVTARHDLDPDELRRETGAAGVIQKPVKKDAFRRKVRAVVGESAASVLAS